MNNRKVLLPLLLTTALTATAQQRSSSSLFLQPQQPADVTLSFATDGEGKRFTPTWGLDLAWISEQNLRKGYNHMGKENVGIGRIAFRFTKPLVNDSVIAPADLSALRNRINIFNKLDKNLPLVFTADQEPGADTYFVSNKSANISHWSAMINSHVHWVQQNTSHPVVGVSPFNEPDYWSVEEGATPAKQMQVAKMLKEKYPRMEGIAIVGGNTLNDDKAWEWFNSGKAYYDWGNTHQLAGSFDNFASFFKKVTDAGKIGYADEMHNVAEAMVGLEYGMTVGIWWGFDSRTRGEFCDISRNGERLAYGEHRNNWTAASVYRHDDGRVKAFVGSSERQAATTVFQFVSPYRDVYYDGYGPLRDFYKELPGGTGYQKGQTNAECVIDITWGEDVPPSLITDGIYKIVNKATGNAVAINNSNIVQQKFTGMKTQQWHVFPINPRNGGDYSYYDIESVNNAKMHINVRDYSTADNAELIAWQQNASTSNEQWYLQYAGDGYYYIRNRESALYMASGGTANTNNVRVKQSKLLAENSRDLQLWRLLPIDVEYETEAPAQPQNLSAVAQQASVRLTWDANSEADVDGYMVLRAPQGSDEWNTIARRVKDHEFVDNSCSQGTIYIYKVKAIDRADNESEPSATATAGPTATPALVAHWAMNENLEDDTENMMDAAAYGSPTFVDGHADGTKALSLRSASKQYVQLPYEVANSRELTFTAWVNLRNANAWQRIFDFGYDTDHYLFLTPSNGSVMRFAIKNGGSEQSVSCKTKLATMQWKHVAVTIGEGRTVIYVDGEEAASSTAITISPADVHPVLNYLGRSQFASDPMLMAYMQDVRIYNYALSADEVKGVMEGTPVGIGAIYGADEANGAAEAYGTDGTYSLSGRRVGDASAKGVFIQRSVNGGVQRSRKVVR